jgi:hypothetical protein
LVFAALSSVELSDPSLSVSSLLKLADNVASAAASSLLIYPLPSMSSFESATACVLGVLGCAAGLLG